MFATVKTTAASLGFFSATTAAYVSFMTKEMERQKAKLEEDNPGAGITFRFRYLPSSGGLFEPMIKQAPKDHTETIRPK